MNAYFASDTEFAEKYREFMRKMVDTSATIYNQSHIEALNEIPSKKEIISLLANGETDTLREDLQELKQYINDRYDDEDPDCASTIHDCEMFIGYLDNFR